MSEALSLYTTAREQFHLGALVEAEKLWKLAAQAAIQEDNLSLHYKSLYWSGSSAEAQGAIKRALSSYLSMRILEQDHPEVQFDWSEKWSARISYFTCLTCNPPDHATVEESLKELRDFSRTNKVPPQDFPYAEGRLEFRKGLWSNALKHFEVAAAKCENQFDGMAKFSISYSASICALRNGEHRKARDWAETVLASNEGFSRNVIRLHYSLAIFEISRAEGNSEECLKLYRELQSRPPNLTVREIECSQVELWGAIFGTDNGDPAKRDHPARRALSRLPASCDHLDDWFQFIKLVLDYRLACLRYAVGLPPHDDQLGNAKPIAVDLKSSEAAEILRRLQVTLNAAAGAERRARFLDSAFASSWRGESISKRHQAIEMIIQSLRTANLAI